MPKVTMLDPLAQYNGTDRFLGHFRSSLQSKAFTKLWMAIAYAKTSGVARIHQDLIDWRKLGGTRTAKLIVGIDQKGTSVQALTLALTCFDEVYIAHTGGGGTFHPKFSVFSGDDLGRVIVGSHNLTCGGIETNLEAGVEIDYALPSEGAEFSVFTDSWSKIAGSAFTKPLSTTLLNQLHAAGSLLDESVPSAKKPHAGSAAKNSAGKYLFPRVNPAPPSPIPKQTLATSPSKAAKAKKGAPAAKTAAGIPASVSVAAAGTRALVIQIKPHANGEIFLSMTAVYQDPKFFDFPFSGMTVPKQGKKGGYPQRSPDPVVDVIVYDKNGKQAVRDSSYNLNTVYYDVNKEIRITMSPHLRDQIDPYSILHMQVGSGAIDYVMEIYNPGSSRYNALLAVCDQTMPSGGKTPRKFGWI